MKTLQEIFDAGLAGMRKYKRPGVHPLSQEELALEDPPMLSCLYRVKNAEGQWEPGCIVGQMLPDILFGQDDGANQQINVAGAVSTIANHKKGFAHSLFVHAGLNLHDPEVVKLMGQMQTLHDRMAQMYPNGGASFLYRIEKNMQQIARVYGLSYKAKEAG